MICRTGKRPVAISAETPSPSHQMPPLANAGAAKARLAARASPKTLGGDIGRDFDREHLVRVDDRLATLDLVHIVHALDDLAPDSVLLVEERRIAEADEELRI